ncbi:MAG: hypothetical protein LUE98_20065 [Tannerellaceae bacterium]|nr:hypothetical protein [Tannerellaceae bacterium]
MNIYGKLLLLKNMELKDISLENVGVISGRDAMVITGIRCDDPLKIEVTCSVTSQLKKQLKDILEVLERSEEKIWRKVFESYLSDLDVLDIEEMKRNIRGIYGGNGFL